MIIRLHLHSRTNLILWGWFCETCGQRRGHDWWASSQTATIDGDCDDCGAAQELTALLQNQEGTP